jgi:hypothetical protein
MRACEGSAWWERLMLRFDFDVFFLGTAMDFFRT